MVEDPLCGAALLSLGLEALNVLQNEIRGLSKYFRATSAANYKKTRFELNKMGPTACIQSMHSEVH